MFCFITDKVLAAEWHDHSMSELNSTLLTMWFIQSFPVVAQSLEKKIENPKYLAYF